MYTARRWLLSTPTWQGLAAPPRPKALPVDLTIEWDVVSRHRCNVLLEGSAVSTAQMLHAMRPHLRAPICEYTPIPGAPLPRRASGTLILFEAGRLDATQQKELLLWLAEPSSRDVQIASTSSESLFRLVQAHAFDAQLYYKLNVVLMNLFDARRRVRQGSQTPSL